MEEEKKLAEDISVTSDKSKYDAACKRLLANKVILAWIMKECLEEYKNYSIQEIEAFWRLALNSYRFKCRSTE